MTLLLLLVISVVNCTKKSPVDSDNADNNDKPPQDEFVICPQQDIPWPGLAQSPWPMYLHDPQHTGRSPYRGPQEGIIEWVFNTCADVYSSPVLGEDGTIYLGSNSMFLYALDPSGAEKWRFKSIGCVLESDPLAANDGTIYFTPSGYHSNENGTLYALNADGTLKWKYEHETLAPYFPTISKDGSALYVVLYQSTDVSYEKIGHLCALHTQNGSRLWTFSADSGMGISNEPAIGPEGTIYCTTFEGNLYAINPDGTFKWEFKIEGLSHLSSTPSVDNDGNIYINTLEYLYSIAKDGTERWRYKNSMWGNQWTTPTIAYDGTIYTIGIIDNGEGLLALDYDGRLKWSFAFSQAKEEGWASSDNSPIVDVDGTVYLGLLTDRTVADSVNFIAINADGTLKFQMSLRSPNGSVPDIDSTPCISSDGTLYVGSDRPQGLHLYAIK